MREKKFANILEEDTDVKEVIEESNEIESIEAKENKLSMTRELKFKEIQDFIDNGEVEEKEIDKVELDEKFQTFISENGSSVDLPLVFDDDVEDTIDEENKKNEDIYLTSSFKPLKSRIKVSKFFKFLFSLLFICTILCAFVYYICFPLYKKIMGSKPEMVFENTIKYVFSEIEHVYGDNIIDSDIYYSDIKLLLNSNIDGLSQYKNVTLGYKYGVDNKLNKSSNYIYVGDNTNYYGINYLKYENDKYTKYSNSQNYLKVNVSNQNYFYNDLSNIINDMSVVTKEEFIYSLQKEKNILLSLIEKDLISASNDELEIGNETLKVIRNSYKLEGYELKQKIKKIREEILADDKLITILQKYNSSLKYDFIQSQLKSLEDNVSKDDKLVFNLYTINGNKLVGFDIEYNGFVNYYFYYNKDNLEAHFNFSKKRECSDGKECVLTDKKVIDLSGNKSANQFLLIVDYNDKKILELSVSELNFNKMDFDYKLFFDNKKIFGDVFFLLNPAEKNYNLNVTYNHENENINININLDRGVDFSFDSILEENVLENNQSNISKEYNDFIIITDEIGLTESFNFWQNFMDDPTETIKDLKLFDN